MASHSGFQHVPEAQRDAPFTAVTLVEKALLATLT